MKGLLIKDILNLKKQSVIFLLFIAFYLVLSISTGDSAMFGGVAAIFCAMLPITALSYDEKAKWELYALAMPISRKDLIVSKYILGLLTAAIAFVIVVIVNLFTMDSVEEALILTSTVIGVGIVFLSIMLPILFKFGVEKARLIMILIFFIPTGCILLLAKAGMKLPSEQTLETLFKFSPLFVIVIFLLSMFLSIRIYEKKEIQ